MPFLRVHDKFMKIAVCCRVLQCVAVRCSVLRCVFGVLQCVSAHPRIFDAYHTCSWLIHMCGKTHLTCPCAVYCSVLQHVAVRCSVFAVRLA